MTTPTPQQGAQPYRPQHAAPRVVPQQVRVPGRRHDDLAAPAPLLPPGPEPTSRRPVRSLGVAYVLWLLLGAVGAHKFYLGRVGMGIAYLLTLGFLTLGLWVDLFTLPRQVRRTNLAVA